VRFLVLLVNNMLCRAGQEGRRVAKHSWLCYKKGRKNVAVLWSENHSKIMVCALRLGRGFYSFLGSSPSSFSGFFDLIGTHSPFFFPFFLDAWNTTLSFETKSTPLWDRTLWETSRTTNRAIRTVQVRLCSHILQDTPMGRTTVRIESTHIAQHSHHNGPSHLMDHRPHSRALAVQGTL
jgi:hypothetical protein